MALTQRLVAGALAVTLLAGCATSTPGEGFIYALNQTGTRTQEAFSDPVRRTHIVSQTSHILSTAGVGITCAVALLPTLLGTFLCPVAALVYHFVVFEYIWEPLSKQRIKEGKPSFFGPYWETGPHSDLGESFVNP